MTDIHDLNNELAFYFKRLEEKPKTLTVYHQVDHYGEMVREPFCRVTPATDPSCVHRFYLQYYDGEAQAITAETLKTIHHPFALLYETIKQHNDDIKLDEMGFWRKYGEKVSRYFSELLGSEVEAVNNDAFEYTRLPESWWKPLFGFFNSNLKRLMRLLIFDSFLSKQTIGRAIAGVANHGNPHYITKPQTLTGTLGPLIFPGGLKEPQVSAQGSIDLDHVLSNQYLALKKQHEVEETPFAAEDAALIEAFGDIDADNEYFHFDALPEPTPRSQEINFEEFKVRMPSGAVMTGVLADNRLVNTTAPRNHLHIIYFNGNSDCYQRDMPRVKGDLRAYQSLGTSVTAVQFNYPGVLNSSGKVRKAAHLIEAGIAQVERLNKELGVPYERIGLHGVSLGGSIVSHVANYYHRRGINLAGTYASKTFSSTTNVAISYVRKLPVIGKVLGFFLRPIIAVALWSARWQLNTAAHFASLPTLKREYSVVRSHKDVREACRPLDDPVLSHFCSLHKSSRLKFDRVLHKYGFFGRDPSTHKVTNRNRKMTVFFKDVDGYTVEPDVCGHSCVPFNYGCSTEPVLMHRAEGDQAESPTRFSQLTGQEAGERVRQFFATR